MTGLLETWMTADLNYDADWVGGPMNIGDGYRLNSPIFTYAFDQSFVLYFGTAGMKAVDEAMAIINNLPPASTTDINRYPPGALRINNVAAALGMHDIKSQVLGTTMNLLGLGAPEASVWNLRGFWVDPANVIHWTVIMRNFDPVTLRPSPYVNNQLYTYQIVGSPDALPMDAIEIPLIPGIPAYSSAGGQDSGEGARTIVEPGLFVTGFSREDAGAWRYLYSRNQLHTEVLPVNSFRGSGGNFGVAGAGGGEVGTTEWSLPGVGAITTAQGGQGTVSNLPPQVDFAVRPGIDKINVVKIQYDSLIGATLTRTAVSYVDNFITNGFAKSQGIRRQLLQPDLLIAAADVGLNAVALPVIALRNVNSFTIARTNVVTGPTLPSLAGPGIVSLPLGITLNKIAPVYRNDGTRTEAGATFFHFTTWGYFDATTNAPIPIPSAVTLKDLEKLVKQRRR